MEILTAEQMRQLERHAIESGQISGLELMERAGQGVVDAVLSRWPEFADRAGHALIWCGPGNNGGDGFVIARLLAQRGWGVDLRFFGKVEPLSAEARKNCDRWLKIGRITPLRAPLLRAVDLEIDALFGIGLTREIAEPVLRQVLWSLDDAKEADALFNADQFGPIRPPRTVAVDIPSGLHAGSGRALGTSEPKGPPAPHVMLTVTFHRRKIGHCLGEGSDYCGELVVCDLGLPDSKDIGQETDAKISPQINLVESPKPCDIVKTSGHKFNHGHALILSGGFGRSGAARLAARGALRIGAGLVTLGVPDAAQDEVAANITALMMARVDTSENLDAILGDPRITALCLGPGLGFDRARRLLPSAVKNDFGCVVDADALSAFAEDPETLFDMLHSRCILTPHEGEFARLFPDLAVEFAHDPTVSKIDITLAAARRAGCVVLFKGVDTVIADPDSSVFLHSARGERASPWLATAGAGDVLAGIITGLIARDTSRRHSVGQHAAHAVWLHVEAARVLGPGLIAEDLSEALPQVLRELTKAQG